MREVFFVWIREASIRHEMEISKQATLWWWKKRVWWWPIPCFWDRKNKLFVHGHSKNGVMLNPVTRPCYQTAWIIKMLREPKCIIIEHHYITSHKNIVTLLLVCWMSMILWCLKFRNTMLYLNDIVIQYYDLVALLVYYIILVNLLYIAL
jgi:hypothetical protein